MSILWHISAEGKDQATDTWDYLSERHLLPHKSNEMMGKDTMQGRMYNVQTTCMSITDGTMKYT